MSIQNLITKEYGTPILYGTEYESVWNIMDGNDSTHCCNSFNKNAPYVLQFTFHKPVSISQCKIMLGSLGEPYKETYNDSVTVSLYTSQDNETYQFCHSICIDKDKFLSLVPIYINRQRKVKSIRILYSNDVLRGFNTCGELQVFGEIEPEEPKPIEPEPVPEPFLSLKEKLINCIQSNELMKKYFIFFNE